MKLQCPKCGSRKVVPVGQYDKYIYGSLSGSLALGIAGIFLPPLWFLIPFWLLGCLLIYTKNPLAECEECHHQWNPRRS